MRRGASWQAGADPPRDAASASAGEQGVCAGESREMLGIMDWLLLDSRVVDVPMSYKSTFVTLSSLKPFFFHGLKNQQSA